MKKHFRVGIFYDGYHVIRRMNEDHNFNPQHFNYNKLNEKILSYVKEMIGNDCKLLFKGWYQGVHDSYLGDTIVKKCTDIEFLKKVVNQYHVDHMNHFKLIEGGIEVVYLPYQKDHEGVLREKGVDVALSVAAGNQIQNLNINLVILLSNDSDYVPLIHNIAKKGITTIIINFQEKASIKLKKIADFHFQYDEVKKFLPASHPADKK